MQIFIATLTGQTTMLLVQQEDTIQSVKVQFKDKQGTPVDQQRLIYGGQELEDKKTLKEYGIDRDATLHFVLRLPGGGPGAHETVCLPL